MNRVSAVRRRAVCALLAICLLLSTSVAFLTGKALDPTQTLKVYAQYWGDPDSATLLKEFTREEIDEIDKVHGEIMKFFMRFLKTMGDGIKDLSECGTVSADMVCTLYMMSVGSSKTKNRYDDWSGLEIK